MGIDIEAMRGRANAEIAADGESLAAEVAEDVLALADEVGRLTRVNAALLSACEASEAAHIMATGYSQDEFNRARAVLEKCGYHAGTPTGPSGFASVLRRNTIAFSSRGNIDPNRGASDVG